MSQYDDDPKKMSYQSRYFQQPDHNIFLLFISSTKLWMTGIESEIPLTTKECPVWTVSCLTESIE